jgi:hypothetical protein
MSRVLAALVVGAALLGGCTTTAAPSSSPPTSSSPLTSSSRPTGADDTQVQLKCAESSPESPLGAIVLNTVALESNRVLQVFQSGETPPPARLFAKTWLWVRAGVAATLMIVDGQGGPTMGWGSPAQRATRVRVPACPALGGTGWIGWPGGFWVANPACVRVAVTLGTRRVDVPMSIGQKCAPSHA